MATHSLAVTSGSTKEEITMQKMESPGHKEIPNICVLKLIDFMREKIGPCIMLFFFIDSC